MKIVHLFGEQLYSFVYKFDNSFEYKLNEYDRLMNLWIDVSYLRKYAVSNNVKEVNQFVKNRLKDAENIQDLLEDLVEQNKPLGYYFRPLFDNEINEKTLSLQKGKVSKFDGLEIVCYKN